MLPDWTVEDSDALDLQIIRGRLRTWGMNPDDAEVIALHSSGHNAADIALTTGRTLSCVQQAWHRYVSQREETIPLRDSRPVKRCAWCADTFRAEHNQRFCAPACQRLSQLAADETRRRVHGVREMFRNQVCSVCSIPFRGRATQKYCGSSCATANERRQELARKRSRGVRALIQDRVCDICGDEYRGRAIQKYCSTSCAQAGRRLRTRKGNVLSDTCSRGHKYTAVRNQGRGRNRCLICERTRTKRSKEARKLRTKA